MNLRLPVLGSILALALGGTTSAQGSVRIVGGGCPDRTPPIVTGPLAIGTTMRVETGCVSSPHTAKFLLIGLALPPTSWVGLSLMTSPAGYSPCDVSVVPVIIGADVSSGPDPLPIPIPNDPIWRGFPLGLQSYCIECGFAGCFPTLTQGIEVTIR